MYSIFEKKTINKIISYLQIYLVVSKILITKQITYSYQITITTNKEDTSSESKLNGVVYKDTGDDMLVYLIA